MRRRGERRTARRFACAVLVVFLFEPSIAAEVEETGTRYRYLDLEEGIDLSLGYRLFGDVDTAAWARVGGEYIPIGYYRMPDLGYYSAGTYPSIDPELVHVDELGIIWGAGLRQGLHSNARRDRNDLDLLAAYIGWWDRYFLDRSPDSLLARASIPDRSGCQVNSFMLDLLYDGTDEEAATDLRNGLEAESWLEYAPPGLSRPATTHYIQAGAKLTVFLPLLRRVTRAGWNLASLYLAGRLGIDCIVGLGDDGTDGVPLNVSQRFGGRRYVRGLGGAVRGYGLGYGDGTFKAVASLEARCNLPALVSPRLIGGILAFLDIGYYRAPPGMDADAVGYEATLSSAGLGAYLDCFDLLTVSAYSSLMLGAANFRGERWDPLMIELCMHF